jgi:type VI secretion system protein ImpA
LDALDLETLLGAVSAESPAGDNHEYDPDFLAMLQVAEGKPERRMGDSLVPAEDPDWRRVRDLAIALLGRSKDIRAAVLLTRAELQIRGMPGLKQGLELMAGLLSRFWSDLHPQLDPDEGLDPSSRVNVLLDLCGLDTLLKPLRATPLIHSRIFGVVTYRDLEALKSGGSAPPETQQQDAAKVTGAFQDCDLDELRAVTRDVAGALAEACALDQALADHVPPQSMPDLSPLTDLLSAIHGVLETRLDERQPPLDVDSAIVSAADSVAHDSSGVRLAAMSAQISSREDVLRALDRICDYYESYEPSSPVPLLLKRARRLATGSFIDIVRDLAPDALSQIQQICGIESEG